MTIPTLTVFISSISSLTHRHDLVTPLCMFVLPICSTIISLVLYYSLRNYFMAIPLNGFYFLIFAFKERKPRTFLYWHPVGHAREVLPTRQTRVNTAAIKDRPTVASPLPTSIPSYLLAPSTLPQWCQIPVTASEIYDKVSNSSPH